MNVHFRVGKGEETGSVVVVVVVVGKEDSCFLGVMMNTLGCVGLKNIHSAGFLLDVFHINTASASETHHGSSQKVGIGKVFLWAFRLQRCQGWNDGVGICSFPKLSKQEYPARDLIVNKTDLSSPP